MSSTVTMPFMLPVGVDDGERHEVVLREHARHRLLVVGVEHRHEVGLHDVAHQLALRAANRSRNETTPSSFCCASHT